jgi:glycosyltransferase involved in cell wall biosynthesis
MHTLLSIVTPVYNAAATVGRTLASLRHIPTEYRPCAQVVVINDGSTDHSPSLIRQASAALAGFRWELLDQGNAGPSAARNAGIAVARGDWVFFLDADDELAFDPFPALRAAGAHTCLAFSVEYRRRGRLWRRHRPVAVNPANWADVVTAKSPSPSPGLLFRRDRIDHGFDEDFACMEDWLFWLRNPGIFERTCVFPETVSAVIHIHDGNSSSDYKKMGLHRARAAQCIAAAYRDRLTRKQANNLHIQAQIGRIQQGQLISPRAFLAWPCNALLFAKLCAYASAAVLGLKATPYGRSRTQSPVGGPTAGPPGP